MKKGVAIPYIIAILLGIAVIGLIGFWLFKSAGIFGTKTVEQDCRNKFLKWCQDWFAAGYADTWMSGGGTTATPWFNLKYPECKPYKLPGTDTDTGDVTTVKSKCFVS